MSRDERVIFAWCPVRKWSLVKENGRRYARETGWYWLRYVRQMKAGLGNHWTAYEHKQEQEQ